MDQCPGTKGKYQYHHNALSVFLNGAHVMNPILPSSVSIVYSMARKRCLGKYYTDILHLNLTTTLPLDLETAKNVNVNHELFSCRSRQQLVWCFVLPIPRWSLSVACTCTAATLWSHPRRHSVWGQPKPSGNSRNRLSPTRLVTSNEMYFQIQSF